MALKTNEPIINHLREIAKIYGIRRETQRAIAFNRAADSLQASDQDVTELPDPTVLPNIGGSTAGVILEFLKTGTSTRYQDLEKTVPKVELKLDLEDFSSVGINALTGLKLWKDHKIGNVAALKEAIKAGTITDENIIKKVNP